jgi:hypothetical protein
MDTRLLSVINALQVQGVLCPPFVGRAAPILRELQPGIVGIGRWCRLFERDMSRTGDGAPGQPTQVDRDRRAARLSLNRWQQPAERTRRRLRGLKPRRCGISSTKY